MRVVVVGGTGLVGSQLVCGLTEFGHEAVAAAPQTGVNTITGEGLPEVLEGTDVVVDVSNSPSFADAAVMEFFTTATTNVLAAAAAAGVGHHVALSVVGTDRLARQSGYFKAKLVQENLIRESPVPFSIVRATQFFEFVTSIAASATEGDTVRLSPALIQPMASADVAEAVAIAAVGAPSAGITEVAGPDRYGLDELIRDALQFRGDPRTVVADSAARYWGAELSERMLLPGDGAVLFETRFADWVRETPAAVR
ncbi:NAD(P)H-binding protein [Mycobacterium sp. 21AC1]|uniref:NmrA family NAD(P)-binding protein n=1 Tax=[Mycobacterium] appelbergii TaxID=2939269 RepID=UPI00293941BA|nr:NAD(P)H-binding protein [Mycobacterium sp. 21AC1]MDV3130094.1 NAD(P)H-binding protein [Mycobacterium sp. 21AC1]